MSNLNENYTEMERFIEELGNIESAIEKQHQKENIEESICGLKEAGLLTTEEAIELLYKL